MQRHVNIEQFVASIKERLPETVRISGSTNDDAIHNMFSLGIDEIPKNLMSKDVIEKIINTATEHYKERNSKTDCKIYYWFDAMAGQLRGSVISKNDDIPFGCEIAISSKISVVVEDVFKDISSLYENGCLDVFVAT